MPIAVVCPECGAEYQVADELAGRRVKCRDCQSGIQVSPAASHRQRSSQTPAGLFTLRNFVIGAAILAMLGFMLWLMLASGDRVLAGWIVGGCALFVGWFLVPCYLGAHLGRGRSTGGFVGFVLGLLLGWIGVGILLCLPYRGQQRTCPSCAERIKAEAKVCRYCGERL